MSKYGQNQEFSAESDRKKPKAFLLTNEILPDQLNEQANRYRVLNQVERIDSIGKIPGPMRTCARKHTRNRPKFKEKTLRLFC